MSGVDPGAVVHGDAATPPTRYAGTTEAAGANSEPGLRSYAGHVIDMLDRLRSAGIEPSGVTIPAWAEDGIFPTFHGLPVAWDCGGNRVQVVVDVAEWVRGGGS